MPWISTSPPLSPDFCTVLLVPRNSALATVNCKLPTVFIVLSCSRNQRPAYPMMCGLVSSFSLVNDWSLITHQDLRSTLTEEATRQHTLPLLYQAPCGAGVAVPKQEGAWGVKKYSPGPRLTGILLAAC
jgi:hypothetical protein